MTSSSPYFSVVIPAYNRADTIMPTLQSVLAQTFEDYECIIVDDGSKDSTQLQAVVEGLNDNRFRYVWRKNGGGGAARNTGIDAAHGGYIAFLDSDDLFLPDKLALDQKLIAEVAHERDIIFSQVIVDRGEGKHWIKPGRGPHPAEDISEYLMCHQGFVQTSTLVLSTDFAKTIRYDEKLPFSQDIDFAVRAAALGANFSVALRLTEYTSGNSYVDKQTQPIGFSTSPSQVSHNFTASQPTTGLLRSGLEIGFSGVFDITLRLAVPQFVKTTDVVPSSPILTSDGAETRAADALTLILPAGTHDLTFTFDDGSTQETTGISGNYLVPTLNRSTLRSVIAT